MRIALGQFNAVVGDLAGNVKKMREMYAKALRRDVDLLVFPELSVCGYPPEDLLLKKHFLDDNRLAVEQIAVECPEITLIVGFAERKQTKRYNSAAVLQKGKIKKICRKSLLPNYGVFDERRYFVPGKAPVVINEKGFNIAVTICADIWNIDWLTEHLSETEQVHIILNLSASPFHVGKTIKREQAVNKCTQNFNCAVGYCNLVGSQDEIVFDGRSVFAKPGGSIIARAKAFNEDLLIAEISSGKNGVIEVVSTQPEAPQPTNMIDEIYQALLLGTKDYTQKNGFNKVLLGLSGGIDSSVVAAIAAAAIGPENVIGITMPSKFNSPETIADAQTLANNLGIEFLTIPIGTILVQFDNELQKVAGWNNKGVAYENLQARIRGSILMSLSNQFGTLVLTTGNKSETAVGYSTLYGDTAGGFAVIKDVPKTLVYQLAEHINKINRQEIIPTEVIKRPPSAELRADQKDSDSLPDYDLLDKILKGYVEEDKSAKELVASGLSEDMVHKIIRLVDRNEYKRRQSPPGIKITPKAFGKDRRLPITNRYSSFD